MNSFPIQDRAQPPLARLCDLHERSHLPVLVAPDSDGTNGHPATWTVPLLELGPFGMADRNALIPRWLSRPECRAVRFTANRALIPGHLAPTPLAPTCVIAAGSSPTDSIFGNGCEAVANATRYLESFSLHAHYFSIYSGGSGTTGAHGKEVSE